MTYFPVLNLNGTSYDELVRQQEEVIAKINAAIEAMDNATPHGRDFIGTSHQISSEIAMKARKRHMGRMLLLTQVRDEHAAILQHIVEAHIEQERVRGRGSL